MRILLLVMIFGLSVAFGSQAEAAVPKKKAAKIKASTSKKASAKAQSAGLMGPNGDLKTDVSFNDAILRGEYQAPEEALVKVENEKGLSDLIGVRKHFKDRLSVAAEQE